MNYFCITLLATLFSFQVAGPLSYFLNGHPVLSVGASRISSNRKINCNNANEDAKHQKLKAPNTEQNTSLDKNAYDQYSSSEYSMLSIPSSLKPSLYNFTKQKRAGSIVNKLLSYYGSHSSADADSKFSLCRY